MRGYVGATAAFAAFFAGLALWVSGVGFRGVDVAVGALYVVGAALGIYLYWQGSQPGVRRWAVVAAGLCCAALVVQLFVTW